MTDSFMPIVTEAVTLSVILGALRTILIMVVVAASLSVIATGVRFYTKSIPATKE